MLRLVRALLVLGLVAGAGFALGVAASGGARAMAEALAWVARAAP